MSDDGFLDGYLPYLLQRADHLMSARFHATLQRSGYQVSEWRVLAVLAQHGPLALTDVADIALLPQPTASHACRRLENLGLLIRWESDTDRRRKMLQLSDDGTDLVDHLIAEARKDEAEVLAGVSIDHRQFAGRLRTLIDELLPRD